MNLQQVFSLVAALLFAALAPTFIIGALDQTLALLPFVFAVALGHAVLLGFPLYLIFRPMRWINAVTCTGAGLIIGAIPSGLLTFPSVSGSSRSVNGIPTVINGTFTAEGWSQYLSGLGFLGLFGALGGLVFWYTLKWTRIAPAEEIAASPPRASYWVRRLNRSAASALIAALLAGTVIAIPSITKDPTCHNEFRDGRTSVQPVLNIDVAIEVDDWPKLTKLLEDFGLKRGMELRNSSKREPGLYEMLYLDLCKESGPNINVVEQRWAHHELVDPRRGVGISFSDVRGSGWEDLARELITELETTWPARVKFMDKDGQTIAVPKTLNSGGR